MNYDVYSMYNRRRDTRVDRVSVGDMIERIRYSYPDKEAVVAHECAYAYPENKRVTYEAADKLANQVAHGLLNQGLNRGDRVVLLADNSTEALLTKYGIAKAGLVAVPINPNLATDVIQHIVNHTEAKFIIADDEYIGKLKESIGRYADVYIPIKQVEIEEGRSFKDFTKDLSTEPVEVTIHGDDIWELLFTSGTTSMPKGAMISHHNTYFAAYDYAMKFTRGLNFESNLKLVSFLTVIYHVSDQTLPGSVFLTAGTLVIGRTHSIEGIAQSITQEKITSLWIGSAEFLIQLTDYYDKHENELNFTSLTTIIYGYSALPPKYHDRLKEIAGQQLGIFESFAQSEAIGGYRFWHDQYPETYRKNAPLTNVIGKPDPILATTLMDKEGNIIEDKNVVGEVVYRSPAMFSGYYKNEEQTEKSFRNGWFHSEDNILIDENNFGKMVDREKNIIKSGGENVSSSRVEGALKLHDSVENAVVIGLDHDHWGEQVTGVVQLREGQEISEEDLISFTRENLAGFETPKKIYFMEELPQSIGGKIKKSELKEMYNNIRED